MEKSYHTVPAGNGDTFLVGPDGKGVARFFDAALAERAAAALKDTSASDIVDAIIDDILDRRGLRQAWESIDPEILDEIREAWIQIATRCCHSAAPHNGSAE